MRHRNEIPDDFVKLATHICPICGVEHQHETEVLLHKNLRPIKGDPVTGNVVTGYGLCEEHQKLHDDGYIALIEVDGHQSEFNENGNVVFEGAHRTGVVAFIQKEAFAKLFDVDIGEKDEFLFISEEVINDLKSLGEKV